MLVRENKKRWTERSPSIEPCRVEDHPNSVRQVGVGEEKGLPVKVCGEVYRGASHGDSSLTYSIELPDMEGGKGWWEET